MQGYHDPLVHLWMDLTQTWPKQHLCPNRHVGLFYMTLTKIELSFINKQKDECCPCWSVTLFSCYFNIILSSGEWPGAIAPFSILDILGHDISEFIKKFNLLCISFFVIYWLNASNILWQKNWIHCAQDAYCPVFAFCNALWYGIMYFCKQQFLLNADMQPNFAIMILLLRFFKGLYSRDNIWLT